MAFDSTKLNNIGGSMGRSNLWIYTDLDNTLATIDANDWFANSAEFGAQVGDSFLLAGSDGCALGSLTTLSTTTSVLTTVTAIA